LIVTDAPNERRASNAIAWQEWRVGGILDVAVHSKNVVVKGCDNTLAAIHRK
jgi:hypothetical protein